ncbi:MAG: hypothetical protein QG594_1657 [Bacteroidota bacterium]|nr:hypothetical protein [Bacteroidota bacterium]
MQKKELLDFFLYKTGRLLLIFQTTNFKKLTYIDKELLTFLPQISQIFIDLKNI